MKSLAEESAGSSATASSSSSSHLPAVVPPGSPSILMVDDHPARLLTYEAILTGMPVQCVRAHSGEEALQLLLKQSFALILLDVNMPGMDGYEVARYVRAHVRLGKTPIIFVSGDRLNELDRLKGYEVGALDYISVPVVPEILRSKVALLVELYHRRAELDQLNRSAAGAKAGTPDDGVSAQQLHSLFEHSPDMQFILRGERDVTGALTTWRYVDANASALAIYKRTREEIVGRTVRDTFPAHAARAELVCRRALLDGERLQYETTYEDRQLLVRVFAVAGDCVALCCTDITDRKRTESALVKSERRFQALIEGCAVGVAQNGLDGRFQYVNAGFCHIVGYTAEELHALTWQQITHPDDLDADRDRARQVLAGDIPHYTIEKRYVRKDGTPVWVSMFGNFIFDEQRLPIQGVAVVVDITARKLADLALRESRQRLVLAHEAARLGTFDWNIARDTATWDARARELWGLAPEVPLDLATVMRGIHVDDHAAIRRSLDAALDPAGSRAYLASYRVINAIDGRLRWIESHGQVMFEGSVPVRMVGTIRDVTERVEVECSLREGEERFRELANNIDQMVWTCDSRGQPAWYNDRWYDFAGTRLDQMVDEGWRTLVHPAHRERVGRSFRACVADGRIWEETFPVRGKDGAYRWFLSRAIPIKSSDGTVLRWFGTNTDITAQKRLQDALTDADRRKDEFLAMLAHELRNPVAPIVNVAQILARQLEHDPQASSMVSIVQRQAGHLARLLDDLLDVARITRGRIELQREVLDVNECIAIASETVEPLLHSGQHRLEISRAPEHMLVDVDRVRLTQCLTNLLNNAARYSSAGTLIQVRTYRRDDTAIIEVRDQGRGIAPALLPNIFELFAQDQKALDRKAGGLGIGLSVCKRLMEMHGGTVAAHSDGVGRGATFTLTLPLVPSPAAGDASGPAGASATPRRILIVDDNVDAAESIAMLLQLSGHETRVAHDGPQALDHSAEFAPDVIVLDIGLPGMDGYEVIHRLRAAGFAGRAIALSGYGQPEDRQKSVVAGFDAHLVKPVDLGTLEAALAS